MISIFYIITYEKKIINNILKIIKILKLRNRIRDLMAETGVDRRRSVDSMLTPSPQIS